MLYLEHFGLTDAGKVRKNNEDSMLVGDGRDETLFAVADGIGGFEAGEVASSIAIEALWELEPGDPFNRAIREANRRILAASRADEKLSGMGTTVVAVRFGGSREAPQAEIAHVGDSRAYLLRGGELTPLTEDHSLVAQMVRSGDLTRDQATRHPQKNLITRALGAEDHVEVDTTSAPVELGDRFLLCSDGLSDMVPEDRIAEILSESPGNPERPARELMDAALDAGGTDNVTVVLVDVKEHAPRREEPAPSTSEMQAVPPQGADGRSERREGRRGSRRPRKQPSAVGRFLGRVIRGLAALAVVLLLLSPVYLWGSSRYYFGFEGNEVVIYQGLPYAPLGIELNEEWRRTGLEKSEINRPYQDQIRQHRLHTREEAEEILRDLRRS
jgi:serine/threonine protein phosphatase PrpC